MNYLMWRYRKTGNRLDNEMLHTLDFGMPEIIQFVGDYKWGRLTEVELCAIWELYGMILLL